MSRLFPDTVHIGIYADRVVLARVRRFGTVPAVQRLVQHAALGEGLPGAAALDTLDAALNDSRWHGADAQVLVSNALVRYAVVPASPHLMSIADEVALARLKFQQIHGGAGEDWEVRLGNVLSGKDQIAAAFERAFLDRLRASLAAARLCVRSIEPLLARTFNRFRGNIAAGDFWFAHAEPGLLMLACVREGNWTELAGSPLQGPLTLALPAQLREAKLQAGGTVFPRRVYVCAHGLGFDGIAPDTVTEFVDLAQIKGIRYTPAECELGLAAGE